MEDNLRERMARVEERCKTLFTMAESNAEAVLRLEDKVDDLIANDIKHLKEVSADGWRVMAKTFGAGGAGALIIEFILRVVLPAVTAFFRR